MNEIILLCIFASLGGIVRQSYLNLKTARIKCMELLIERRNYMNNSYNTTKPELQYLIGKTFSYISKYGGITKGTIIQAHYIYEGQHPKGYRFRSSVPYGTNYPTLYIRSTNGILYSENEIEVNL